jgi:hypothetical protein
MVVFIKIIAGRADLRVSQMAAQQRRPAKS